MPTKPLTDAEIADLRAMVALWDARTVTLTGYLAPTVTRLLDELEARRKAADEVVASICASTSEGSAPPHMVDWLRRLTRILRVAP